VRAHQPTTMPVSEAAAVMEIVFAAKVSAREGRKVAVGHPRGSAAR